MAIEQHTPEQPMDQRRNQKGNLRNVLRQMIMEIKITKTYGLQHMQC